MVFSSLQSLTGRYDETVRVLVVCRRVHTLNQVHDQTPPSNPAPDCGRYDEVAARVLSSSLWVRMAFHPCTDFEEPLHVTDEASSPNARQPHGEGTGRGDPTELAR